jgi:magnesium transporter
MIVHCFRVNETLPLTAVPYEQIAEVHQTADARIWLDVQVSKPEELTVWLDRLEVGGLARRLSLEERNRCGFYPLKDEVFLVLPVLSEEDLREVDYVAFLCREDLLLTSHAKSIFSPRKLAALHESEAWLPERSVAGLVAALMIDLSLECLRHTKDLRDAILALEARMGREPNAVEADEILERRSRLLALGTAVSDQLPIVQGLSVTSRPFLRLQDAQEYMSCALTNLQAADNSLTWLDGRITALYSGFQMHSQDRTNRRLGTLTILSAIFMPVTLLAGIWGMNFDTMPELKYPLSYPLALGFMALVGCGMYLFFRRTGWFD